MKIDEWCPFCETEVELPTQAMKQRCPVCGEVIIACSQCMGGKCSECEYEKPPR